MRLPSLPFFKKAIPKEYFLALLLQDEILQAVVFEEVQGTIHIIGEGKSTLPAPLDDTTFEELLDRSDKAISIAESKLPDNIQSHKTIFGVKENWTKDLQIQKDHLTILKRLCDELDLQPIGFLVFAEAIAHLLQKEEGVPVSGVFVELGTSHISATLLRAGRVIGSRQIAVEDNLPKAVDALLMKFTDAEILPSRIILLDNEKRSHLVQQFTNHAWSKQLPFLHVPQITALADGFEKQAILFGTATQMGFDVLGITGIKTDNQESRNKNHEEETQGVARLGDPQKIPASDSLNEDISGGEERQDPAIANENTMETTKEIEGLIEPKESSQQEESEEKPTETEESFGFIQDADVLEKAPKKPVAFDNFKNADDETLEELASETFADIPEEAKEESLQSRLPGLGVSGVKITEGMQSIFSRMRKIPFSSFFSSLKKVKTTHVSSDNPSRKWLFLLPIILLVIVLGILGYIFGVKATATLYINPKNVNASQGITFSSSQSTDTGSDTIGGSVTPISESGTASIQASGSQDVGDKAKGAVTIYNNDNVSHTINAGTTIISSNGLQFVTNNDATVSSASGDIFSGTQPGTQNVDVTAANIGTDYNLPSGTKFSIGDSTVIAAKNGNAFSGGTKKTVTVVSQKDLDTLSSNLTKTLGDKAKQDAQNNTSSDKAVLSTFLDTTMSNQKFDHKLGDQVSSVNLSATITYSALTYNKADLDKIALAIIQSNNQGENISANDISEDIQNPTVSKDGKDINATLAIKAGLLPTIDTKKVAQELAGKSFAQALNNLSDIPQLDSVQSVLSPNLFFLPKLFPRMASHITVGVKANE